MTRLQKLTAESIIIGPNLELSFDEGSPMSVAVSCNLSEGVILGVDSAVTVPSTEGGIAKVFEHAEKLFQFGDKPIGIATFGLASFESRSIGSHIRELEIIDPDRLVKKPSDISNVVESLRKFFMEVYRKTIIPVIEEETKKKYKDIPPDKRPAFGLVVGGFSSNAYLSEVWEVDLTP